MSGGGAEHIVADLDFVISDHVASWEYDGVLGMTFFEQFAEVRVDLRTFDTPIIEVSWG